MVSRASRNESRRAGASLLECVAALALLGAGLGAVAATGTSALRTLNDAEAVLAAAQTGARVLDSLALHASPVAGTATHGRLRLTWTVSQAPHGSRFDLVIRDSAGREWFEAGGRAGRWPTRISVQP